jgi:tRNA(Ile)-lysidine synthase
MQQVFLHHIKKRKLCTPSDKILLAVSGGIDSMMLLDLFLSSGFKIFVAHVNFKLRGDESDKDENFVREKCLKYSIPFFTTSFNTEGYAQEKKLSIQMAARELRYAWFKELMTEYEFDCLATAHHLNDSIETALLNMIRGSGLEGWDGIAERNGKIIRPLLFATRTQIENYAADHQITWREDNSNSSDDYQRNFIRHRIMPLLAEVNPSLENSFANAMDKISSTIELADVGLSEWKQKFIKEKNQFLYISKQGLDSSMHPEGLLWNVTKNYGFNLDQCSQVVNSLNEQSGKVFYSPDYELVIDRSDLILSRRQDQLSEVLINESQTNASLGSASLQIETLAQASISNASNIALIDADKLKFPLVWRRWREGDYFYPLGMQHKKKISDFLIDQKLSLNEKKVTSLLCSGDDVVWVVGLRLDDRFKITSSTKKFLRISVL